MALEPNFRYLDDLVAANPADSDDVSEGDDHLRGIKSSLLANVTGNASVTRLLVGAASKFEVSANLAALKGSAAATVALRIRDESDDSNLLSLFNAGGSARAVLRSHVPGNALRIEVRNALDTADEIAFAAVPDGAAALYYDGTQRITTTEEGGDVGREGAVALNVIGTGVAALADLSVRNSAGGATLRAATNGDLALYQLTGAGALEDQWLTLSRDGGVGLRYNNTERLATTVNGAEAYGTDLALINTGATQTRYTQRNNEGGFQLQVDSDAFSMWQTDAQGDPEDVWISGANNGALSLWHNGIEKFRTAADGAEVLDGKLAVVPGDATAANLNLTNTEGGLVLTADGDDFSLSQTDAAQVVEATWLSGDNNGRLQLYHAGNAKVRTKDHAADYASSGLEVKDHAGNWREVGWNVIPPVERNSNLTLTELHTGKLLRKSNTGNTTYTLEGGTSGAVPPVGSTTMVANEGTGTITLAGGTGVTLRWLQGTGTPSTGNRTVSEGGVATIYKYSGTEWWVWGNGIS